MAESIPCGMCGTLTVVGIDCANCGNKLVGTTDSSQRMSSPIQEVTFSKLTDSDRQLFLHAWGRFGRTGSGDVKCDLCGSEILFDKTGTSVKHSCRCGKFSGTLRGL